MEIICDSCDSKFRIADEKIPEGRSASLSCPKCQNKITVNRPPAAQPTPPADSDDFDFDYDYSDHSETTDGTFDFAEDEGKTALICAMDPAIIEQVSKVMNFLEFHVTVVENARDAIKRMRYHQFDAMLVDENFDCRDPDTNGILIYLSRMHMSTRRDMFVVMFTERYQTLDNMTALHKSVNLIINIKNMDRFENIIKKSLSDGNMFYRVYHETRKKIGLE
jgi:predicted Zn finger-like uncharacterized protein